MTKRLAALALIAAIAPIGAGCGSDEPSVTDTAGSGATTETSARSQAVRFAECMRDNGVSGFPDPDPSEGFTIDAVVNGSSLDTEGPAWKAAIAACKDLQPAGFTGPGRRDAEQQKGALAFAKCIRDNGVHDFPDPINGEPLVDTRRIPSTDQSGGMARLNAAMQTCRRFGPNGPTGR